MVLGITFSVCLIVATAWSVICFFSRRTFETAAIRTASSTWCDLHYPDGVDAFSYLTQCGKEKHMDDFTWYTEFLSWLLMHKTACDTHMTAAIISIWYTMTGFNEFSATRWVGDTMMAATPALTGFLPVLLFLVSGFSVVIYVRFSTYFEQFATFETTFFTLITFTFSVSSPVDTGLKPLMDKHSTDLQKYLLVYSLVVLLVLLNVFTAIIIDANERVKKRAWQPWMKETLEYLEPLVSLFFPHLKEDEDGLD